MKNRNAITITNDDEAYTFLKPFSGQHVDKLFIVYENAYGEFEFSLKTPFEIKDETPITEEEFNKILLAL